MKINPGSTYGLKRLATVLKYNEDGTMLVALDQIELQGEPQRFNIAIPLDWAGPKGEFAGGYPAVGSSLYMVQGQGGRWVADSYIPSRNVFSNKMGAFRPGRYLIQVNGGNRAFLDPKLGFQTGDSQNYLHVDPVSDIISHNFYTEFSFTEASRSIKGIIKRDLSENSNRNLLGNTLNSHIYDENLFSISMDPTSQAARSTIGGRVRNPPLVESREITYEFANSFDVSSDLDESKKIGNDQSIEKFDPGRKGNRTDALSLGLNFPNHLIETIKGTAVDLYGNILDLNRAVLPIGKSDALSVIKNTDKADAYGKIRAQIRKSIAYHFEINTRKPGISELISSTPDPSDNKDYARSRSRFFVDVDKEGQFKINVPASSEVGNIPLATRYENFSTLLAKKDPSNSPNQFIKNSESQEIFLDNFGKGAVTITGDDSKSLPIDRITDTTIKYGTVFHDISSSFSTFRTGRQALAPHDLTNSINSSTPYTKIVSTEIVASGDKANAGGRSGAVFMDGFISLNVGANTIDRQSMWADFAGGIVTQVGRDRRGISYAGKMDGDVILEVGGSGIGNSADSRFSSENDGARAATVEIHVLKGDGLMTVFKLGPLGVNITTQGRLDISAQQDIVINSNGRLHLNAEDIVCYSNSSGQQRVIKREPTSI